MKPAFVLVHSPLVGPLTWAPVSRELRQRGIETVLPVLTGEEGEMPYWAQHASAVGATLAPLAPDRRLILVGHSGAGPLLPVMATFSPHPMSGYIFVDASLPHPGWSSLQDLEADMPDFAADLRQELEAGGSFPRWTDDDLRPVIPDEGLRRGVLAELQPRGLASFREPLPSFAGWPDAPCAYLRLSEGYDRAAEQARSKGWAYREFDAGHFHMLVDPAAVAGTLLHLASSLLSMEGDLFEGL